MTEKQLEIKTIKQLRLWGAWVVKIHGHAVGRVGIPDLLACYNGRFVAIEVKTPKGIVSDVQSLIITKIKRAGGLTFVIRDKSQLVELAELMNVPTTRIARN